MSYKYFYNSTSVKNIKIRNLLTSLFIHGYVKTTASKKDKLIKLASKVITLSKKNDLSATRAIKTMIFDQKLNDKSLVYYICHDISKKYKNKQSGYVSTYKYYKRQGDASLIYLVKLN